MHFKPKAIVALAVSAISAISSTVPSASLIPLLGTAGASRALTLANQSRGFVQNLGQWDAQAQYQARYAGANMWITDTGVVYDFYQMERTAGGTQSLLSNQQQFKISNCPMIKGHVVSMEFEGGLRSGVVGEERLTGDYNYFIGKDASRWAAHVPRYAEARSERIYPGISARWYFDQGAPRYDLVIEPGADPTRIAMRFRGANGVSSDGKTLVLGTSLGSVEHRGLFAYQKVGNRTQQVPCSMRVQGNVVRFELGSYDKSQRLVIDPLIWSSFAGGTGGDVANCLTLDSSGNPIAIGITYASDFPTTVGAYDSSNNGGGDVFIAKMTADGSSLGFATFIGGSNYDEPHDAVMDSAGNIAIGGVSLSSNFPTSAGAFDTSSNGSQDGFVSKISSDGATLMLSTYFGGSLNDQVWGLALAANDDIFAVGDSFSSNLPTTAGAYDTSLGGQDDCFAAKLAADGSNLIYCTFVGSSSYEGFADVVAEPSGSIVAVGGTNSSGFPTTSGALDQSFGGAHDGVITRISADGSALSLSTFLGGSGDNDTLKEVALDSSGNIVVAGYTVSTDYPTTAGAYGTSFNGQSDGTVSKLTPNGSSLIWSTYIGGPFSEELHSLALGANDDLYLAGSNYGGGFPTTANAFDSTFNGGGTDGVVAKLSAEGSTLQYASYLGGANEGEHADSVRVDTLGRLITAGGTSSSDFPTTVGAFDISYGSFSEPFVSVFLVNPPAAVNNSYSTTPNVPLNVSAPGVLGNDTNSPDTAVLVGSPSHAVAFSLNSDGSFTYTPNTGYTGQDSFTYKAQNGAGQSAAATVTINVYPQRDAQYVSQSVPTLVAPGATFSASVTMKNVGLDTWSEASGFRMMSQNPFDNATWGYKRMFIPGANTVVTGANRTFTRNFIAPSTPGVYNFQWRMHKEGSGNFGAFSQNVAILVSNTARDAQFVSQIVPGVVAPGATFQAKVTMRNIGLDTWSEANGFRLMSQNPFDNATWGFKRMFIAGTTTVAPGATYQFVRNFTAPSTPGLYNFQWRMQKEGTGNFGAFTQNIQIAVTTTARDAQFISQTVPTTVSAGSTFSASITMRNIGTDTWSEANGFRLMSQNPFDNATWGFKRFFIYGTTTVAPGNSYTFTRNLTAPNTPGTYNFQWRMHKEGTGNFGAFTVNVVVTVT